MITGPMKVKVEIEVQEIADEIISQLTEDGTLAEVVRCKDCKYYWKNSKYEDDMDAVAMCLASPEDDAFCSMGERQDDGT